jgi:hypothetical protein
MKYSLAVLLSLSFTTFALAECWVVDGTKTCADLFGNPGQESCSTNRCEMNEITNELECEGAYFIQNSQSTIRRVKPKPPNSYGNDSLLYTAPKTNCGGKWECSCRQPYEEENECYQDNWNLTPNEVDNPIPYSASPYNCWPACYPNC